MNGLKSIGENGLSPFRFAAEKISFEPALFRFIELESRFEPEFEKTAGIIDAAFKAELEDIIDYTENIDGFLKKVFVPLSEFASKQLSLEGCYDYDVQTFYKNFAEPRFERLLLIRDELKNELERMDEEQAMRNAMRVERRKQETREASRRIWVDWQGNIRNGGSSEESFQYMKNLFGRTMDAINNSAEREKLYDASKNEIKKELMSICFDLVGSVAYVLNKNAGIDIRDTRTQEDFSRSRAIFNNLRSGVVPAEQINEAAVQVFRLNPQENGFLAWCVEQYGDPDGEISRAAELFHVDIAPAKRKKLEATVNLNTEADALASKKALETLQSQLSCPAPDLVKKIDDALVKFDLEFRTVDGVEYKTREEASLARQELEEVKKISERYPLDNLENSQAFLDAIAAMGLKTSVADKYVKKAQEAFAKFDLEIRTVDGEEYKTREEASLARQELEEVKKVSERYPLDNPEKCQAFLDAVASLGLKTSVADKYVKAARDRFSRQKDKLGEIIKKYKMSQENANILLTRHSALGRSGLDGLKTFELGSSVPSGVADVFHVSADDIVLAHINLFGSEKKGGLLISQNGIYSSFIPFCKTKAGVISMIVVALLFLLLLFITIGSAFCGEDVAKMFGFWTFVLFVVLLNLLPFRKIYRSFTKWSDVSLPFSIDKNSLKINKETSLPHFKKTKAFLEKLNKTIEEQNELLG